MPTPVTNATVTFTYNIADELYSTSNSENRTATAVYTGPNRTWVFVDAETGDVDPFQPIYTTENDGADVPTPVGKRKVEINAETDPLIASLFYASKCEVQNQETVTETLPDGKELNYNKFPTPTETYDLDKLAHDGSTWVLPSFRSSPVTWEELISVRNNMLTASDGRISPDMPAELKQVWIDYRQALRDFPTTFGKGTDNEVAAWKITLPTFPTE